MPLFKYLCKLTNLLLSLNVAFQKFFTLLTIYWFSLTVLNSLKYLSLILFNFDTLALILRIFMFKLSVLKLLQDNKC